MDRTVQRAVLDQLARYDTLVSRTTSGGTSPATRARIRAMTASLRALLVQHEPDDAGRCPVCTGWLRPRAWPCRVWTAAHALLIGETGVSEQVRDQLRTPRAVQVLARGQEWDTAQQVAIPEQTPIHRASVVERAQSAPVARAGRRPRV